MTREEALMWLREITYSAFDRTTAKERQAVQMAIEALKDRPKGEWTNEGGEPIKDKFCVYCSECKEWSEYRTNYCGNCGARMKGGAE